MRVTGVVREVDEAGVCCSFFRFAFTPAGDEAVWMDVDVPAARVEVLDGLVAQATQAAGVGR